MALVTISGYPCSGKTRRALQLQHLLEQSETGFSIAIINEESIGVDVTAFDEAKTEKIARANLLSNTIRSLARDRVTICDGMNYIKGFRYQLYCAAREVGCRTLTIHVASPPDKCRQWNAKRTVRKYASETLDNLISRFEEPSFATRWDSPLITIPWDEDQLPSDQILQAVLKGDLRPPNQATAKKPVSTGGYLQRLESLTNAAVASILQAQSIAAGQGGQQTCQVSLSDQSSHIFTISLPIAHPVATPQLQRLRRQYILLNKQTTGELSDAQVVDLFAEYLQSALR